MGEFKRNVLKKDDTKKVTTALQQRLVDLIDLALQLKQAHWCVVGVNFRAVHLQLDEIIEDVRNATDEIAERIAALGVTPDGRAKAILDDSQLEDFGVQFLTAEKTVSAVADRLQAAIKGLRDSIEKVGDIDPISEDMLIAISAAIEKHLWMVQAQEM